MKIEQDLRIVIKAAADVSKKANDRYASQRDRKEAVEKFLKAFPTKRMRINKLVKDSDNARKTADLCDEKLEKEFGLSRTRWNPGNTGLEVTTDAAFVKAGGKLAKSIEFTAEQVIAEYAATKNPAEAAAVLKKYGIVWK